jgi:hypothetical protein
MFIKDTQNFPLQEPPKLIQNGIFGLKTNHLATLLMTLAKREGLQCRSFL